MLKPYITKKILIIEAISFIMALVSVIMALILFLTAKESSEVLFLVLILFLTCIIVVVVIHFAPVRFWNMPVKVNPAKANIVYRDAAEMTALTNLEIAVFSIVVVLGYSIENIEKYASIFLVGATIVTVVIGYTKIIIHNK